jgi:hypothetical protein
MWGHFGFSAVGAGFLIGLLVPNIVWARFAVPDGYDAVSENRLLRTTERTGQVLTAAAIIVFRDTNVRAWSPWSWWLVAACALMIGYELAGPAGNVAGAGLHVARRLRHARPADPGRRHPGCRPHRDPRPALSRVEPTLTSLRWAVRERGGRFDRAARMNADASSANSSSGGPDAKAASATSNTATAGPAAAAPAANPPPPGADTAYSPTTL